MSAACETLRRRRTTDLLHQFGKLRDDGDQRQDIIIDEIVAWRRTEEVMVNCSDNSHKIQVNGSSPFSELLDIFAEHIHLQIDPASD